VDAHAIRFMQHALALARKGAGLASPNPMVGCVIVREGQIVGEGFHQYEWRDHAEVVALKSAGEKARGATVYVTLEPCPMCAGAIVLARIPTLVFARFDPKAGACGTLYNLAHDRRLNHTVHIISGVCDRESEELLKGFFGTVRHLVPRRGKP
jgi:tRNA(Arg) A34 adenosine deaminase TadA